MRALASGIPAATRRPDRPVTDPAPKVVATPPIRLRFVLFAALAYGAWSLTGPRLSAAWKLHGQAAALADYGACMAGPTGPGLLRDHQLDAFGRLLQRRLVAAAPNEAPFERCAPLSRTLTGLPDVETAHRTKAGSFAEYGTREKPERTLAALGVSSGGLAELARAAWPFVRGYTLLVKPSLSAKEAPHPVSPPTPAVGRGLPAGRPLYRATRVEQAGILLAAGTGANSEALRSTDGGATFRPVSSARVEGIAGRCPAGSNGRAFTLGSSDDGGASIASVEQGLEPRTTPLGRPNEEVVALACDEQALVAALRTDGAKGAVLRQCAFGGACAALPAPAFSGSDGGVGFPVERCPRPGNDHRGARDGKRRARGVDARRGRELDAVFGGVRRARGAHAERSAADRATRDRTARAAPRRARSSGRNVPAALFRRSGRELARAVARRSRRTARAVASCRPGVSALTRE